MTQSEGSRGGEEIHNLARRLLELLTVPSSESIHESSLLQNMTPRSTKESAETPEAKQSSLLVGEHDQRVFRYPIVEFEMPILVQPKFQHNSKAMSTAINIRISLALSLTLRAHLECLPGVTQSEWIRDALLAKLSVEQKERARRP